MRTVFIQGEIEESAATRAALAERFTRWCGQDPDGIHAALAEVVLEDKLLRDGLLAQCTESDLERLLTEVLPGRLRLVDNWLVVPAFLRSWVSFLEDEGLLMPEGSSSSELHAVIDRREGDYLSAMADPMRWSTTKFWFLTMREHGVDLEDEAAVERFFAAVEEDEVEVDRTVLEHLEEREEVEPEPVPAVWLPPVAFAEERAPVAEDETAPILSRMRALVEWVGEGRGLDESGSLDETEVEELAARVSAADQFEVEVLVEWAQLADLLRAVGDRLVPSQISAGLLENPDLLWSRLWERFPLLDEVFGGLAADLAGDDEEVVAEEDMLPEMVRDVLHALHSGGVALPLDLVADLGARSALDSEELSASEHEVFRTLLRRVLDQWQLLGVVRVSPTTDPEQIELIGSAVPEGVDPDPSEVELLPLGVRAAREALQSAGFVVPTVAELARQPAEVLVQAVLASPSPIAEPAIVAWIEHRGSKEASLALTSLLRRVDDPGTRLTALAVLEHTEADGMAAVLDLCEDPIAGPAARVWLQSRSTSTDVAVRAGDELMLSLDALAVTLAEDVGEFLEQFREPPTPEQVALIDEIPRTHHASAGVLLEAVAREHPDERVVGAAKRALDEVGQSPVR